MLFRSSCLRSKCNDVVVACVGYVQVATGAVTDNKPVWAVGDKVLTQALSHCLVVGIPTTELVWVRDADRLAVRHGGSDPRSTGVGRWHVFGGDGE